MVHALSPKRLGNMMRVAVGDPVTPAAAAVADPAEWWREREPWLILAYKNLKAGDTPAVVEEAIRTMVRMIYPDVSGRGGRRGGMPEGACRWLSEKIAADVPLEELVQERG